MGAVLPVRFDVTRFLASHDFWAALDFSALPDRYRQPLRDYLARGVLPDRPLLLLIEGNIAAIGLFRGDLDGLLEVADWLGALPGCCWGTRDQVQLWASFAQRRADAQVAAEQPERPQ
jgi:hypothetical protein